MVSETEGRAHGRAPGLVAAAGARARLRPVNNAARQLGPRGPKEKVARIKAGKGLCSQERPAGGWGGEKPAELREAWPELAMPRLLVSLPPCPVPSETRLVEPATSEVRPAPQILPIPNCRFRKVTI